MKGAWDFDRDPLAALRRGDPTLFEEFVRCEAGTFIGFFRRLGAERSEAEDLAQEVFLKLFRAAETYQAKSAFEAYSLRVARNAWIDRHRRRGARPRLRSFDQDSGEEGTGLGDFAGPSEDPGRALAAREDARALRAALAGLSRAHAAVFELAVVQERPYAEIAELLGIPVGTVKSRVFHALRKLRAALETEDEAGEARA